MINYIINFLAKHDINRIFILTGHKSFLIHRYLDNKFKNFVEIKCIKEKKIMGTGGALYNLKNKKLNDFYLLNGDTIFEIDLKKLVNKTTNKTLGAMSLRENFFYKSNSKLNNITIKDNKVSFSNKGKLMNGGVYFFKKKILNLIPNKNVSLENEILPSLINSGKIVGIKFDNFFLDIGTPETFIKAEKKIFKIFNRPAAFLDRDGVINYDFKYVHKPAQFKFRPGVIGGLKKLIKKNYYIFIVTNQAGIAIKKFKKQDFYLLHKILKKKLQIDDIYFNDVKYCLHHPKAIIKEYKKNCKCRKPGNKMLLDLIKEWDIDLKKSFMIGDNTYDKLCAKKTKVKFYFAKPNFNNQISNILKK